MNEMDATTEYTLEVIEHGRCATTGCDLLPVRRLVRVVHRPSIPILRERPSEHRDRDIIGKHCKTHGEEELANLLAREDSE